ncbi:MAG: methylglyoxal synthase [Bacteroidales bacterium]|nr:methylglyoxal synthase [Bacteroidales bacterium]
MKQSSNNKKRGNIALIAHDGKKADMVKFVMDHKEILSQYQLHATGTTGQKISETGLSNIIRYNSGPYGGDAEIGTLVAKGVLDMVFFFRDPLGKHPHDPDIATLMRLCDVWEIPLATNKSTARILLSNFTPEY